MSCFCGLCCLVFIIFSILIFLFLCLLFYSELVFVLCLGFSLLKIRDFRLFIGFRKVGFYWVGSMRIFSKKKVEVKFLIFNLESYRNVKWM